jgi:diaminopimelate decarboxylase
VSAKDPQQRPPGFTYLSKRQGHRELHADAVPLSRLAQRFGTPLYVYSETTIRERYRQFNEAFQNCEHTVCYSVKANSNLSVLRLLAGLRAGFDIVSGGELQRVLEALHSSPAPAKRGIDRGAQLAKIVFSGVGKLREEIDQALQAEILLFNVESPSELELLAARAAHLRRRAQFAIRVNPHVAAKTHPYISTGLHKHKFGVPWRDAPSLYQRSARERWLDAAGVSVHIGSQITDASPFRATMERIASLVRSLRESGLNIRFVDAGGGLGIAYENRGTPNFPDYVQHYSKALMNPLKDLGIHLLLEPGRAVIAPAGVLLTRVIYRKQNNGKRFVVVDAAMNDLIRPALYRAYHEIVPVTVGDRPTAEKADIVGPVCETGDFFARDRKIGSMRAGDLLAILDAGAYGMSLASNYNSRPRPAEVLVAGRRARLIRRRESMSDLAAAERL